MTKILVEHKGDESVGIPGEQAWIEMDLTGSHKNEIEFIRKELKTTFETIWSFKCDVYMSESEYPQV